jgi:hypothetical protein
MRMSQSVPLVLIGSALFAAQATRYFRSDNYDQSTLHSGSGGSSHGWYGGGNSHWYSGSHSGGGESIGSGSFHSGGFGSSGHAVGG